MRQFVNNLGLGFTALAGILNLAFCVFGCFLDYFRIVELVRNRFGLTSASTFLPVRFFVKLPRVFVRSYISLFATFDTLLPMVFRVVLSFL